METLAKWVQMNLDFVQENFVVQVKPDYAQLALSAFLDRAKLTAEVLFDENPDNKTQLVELWSSFTADPKMIEAFGLALDDLVKSVNDPTLLSGVELVREKLIQTLVVLTDANKMNGEQIAEVWKGFLKSPEVLAFIVANAAVWLDKLPLPAWLKSIINLFIKK